MAIIQKRMILEGSKGKEEVFGLFDTGASYSFIRPELAKRLEIIIPLPKPIELGTAKEDEKVTATHRISVDFYLDGYRFSDEFMLVSNLSEPVIIGAGTMQKWRMKLDFKNDEVLIDPKVTKLRIL